MTTTVACRCLTPDEMSLHPSPDLWRGHYRDYRGVWVPLPEVNAGTEEGCAAILRAWATMNKVGRDRLLVMPAEEMPGGEVVA